jgi:ribonuclease HII
LGLDENGLGPRLGPLIVTAAWARVDASGAKFMARGLPGHLRADLDDSKALVSCHNVSLGEAWARVVVERGTGQVPSSPEELLSLLCLEERTSLTSACPQGTKAQCWETSHEAFSATTEQLDRLKQHLDFLTERGIEVLGAKSEVVCTGRLNHLKSLGIHRFSADLHAMERLILHLRAQAKEPVFATCGKVGGIGKYEPFFGPLAGRLHLALEEGQALSHYRFPELGEIRFVRDADAIDALVMLASLIGKYLRELLMARISNFYAVALNEAGLHPSGYHDPVTAAFVKKTAATRRRLKIAPDCFERRPAHTALAKKSAGETEKTASDKKNVPKTKTKAKAEAEAKRTSGKLRAGSQRSGKPVPLA